MPNYGDIKEISQADAKQLILAMWSGMDLPDDLVFEDGSYPSMVLEAAALIINKGTAYAETMKAFGLSERATGEALTLYSKAVYNHSRNKAESAVFLLELTCQSDVDPYVLNEGDLVASNGMFTYRSTYKGLGGATFPCTLNPGASVLVEFEAERPGADAGSPVASSINRLVTTIVGVTCQGTSRVRAGANTETDTLLRQRNSTIWATRNPLTMTRDTYIYIARQTDSVKRVELDATNPNGEFSIDVIVAGDNGAVENAAIESVLTALQNRAYPPIKNRIRVRSATPRPISLAGTVYYYSGYDLNLVQEAVLSAVNAAVAEMPIGGASYAGYGANVVLRSQFEKAILSAKVAGVDAVKLVVLTSPLEATSLAIDEIVTVDASFIDTLVFHGVQ